MQKRVSILFALAALLSAQVDVRVEPIWTPILDEATKTSDRVEPGQYIFYDLELNQYVARYVPLSQQQVEGSKPVLSPIVLSNQGLPLVHTKVEVLQDGKTAS